MKAPTFASPRLALTIPLTLFMAACGEAGVLAPEAPEPDFARSTVARSTVETLLQLEVGPLAIAHRGMGSNLGEDSSRPVENSMEAVRGGYEAGASVVEIDLQMTADGEIVAWHDDFLDDGTCIPALTLAELEERLPHVVSLQAVLRTALRYNGQGTSDGLPAGLLTVDLKPSSPLCDPDDEAGAAFVSQVVRVVRRMGASKIVYFNSMSPVLLGFAAAEAPEIPRQLTLLFLQMLSPEQVEAALGLPVTIIEKEPDYGLRWGEIGPAYRLPGYASVEQAIGTAHAVGARMISYDLALLRHIEQQQAGAAAALVDATRATGLAVFSGDVQVADDWHFGAAAGAQALYANDVPLAVSLQPPLE